MNFTKRIIDQTACPESGQIFLRDKSLPGFGLRLTKGAKTFILEKRINGRNKRMVIGPYGPLTVDEARKKAEKLIGRIAAGEDPAEERSEKRKEATFKDLATAYLDYARVHNKPSAKNYEYVINRDLLPLWGNRKVTAISKADVSALHSRIGKDHPYGANRLLALIGRIFTLAAEWGYSPEDHQNPARGIQKFREISRDRWVTEAELPRLAAAINKDPNPLVKGALWLYLLTGCRKTELLSSKWEDIDFDRGEMRLPKTKAHRTHHIPLSEPAIRILCALPRFENNPHVFPGRYPGRPLQGIRRPWDAVKKEARLPDVHIHDLRRTLGSWLATSGESLNLIGKILNHSTPRVTQIYSRLSENKVKAVLEDHGRRLLAAAEKNADPVEKMVDALWKAKQ